MRISVMYRPAPFLILLPSVTYFPLPAAGNTPKTDLIYSKELLDT